MEPLSSSRLISIFSGTVAKALGKEIKMQKQSWSLSWKRIIADMLAPELWAGCSSKRQGMKAQIRVQCDGHWTLLGDQFLFLDPGTTSLTCAPLLPHVPLRIKVATFILIHSLRNLTCGLLKVHLRTASFLYFKSLHPFLLYTHTHTHTHKVLISATAISASLKDAFMV